MLAKIRWAPRLPPALLQRLYDSDAGGFRDDALCEDVGVRLYERCRTFVLVSKGEVECPVCRAVFGVAPEGRSGCPSPGCGWSTTPAAYRDSIRNHYAHTGRAIEAFADFHRRYPAARSYRDRILLIDALIHAFHLDETTRAPVKSVASKLFEGSKDEVVRFLDRLSSADREGKERWRRVAAQTLHARVLQTPAVASDPELHSILARAFPGARVGECRELRGGVSARSVVAEVELPDAAVRRVVVRRPGWPTREETLRVVSAEHALLGRCRALGILAPEPLHLDAEAAALVLDYVEGAPAFAPADAGAMAGQMAEQLARIHRARLDGLAFLPRRDDTIARHLAQPPERLDASLDEAKLRGALAERWPFERHNADALLHGDFWPGNLLWRDERLVAVLDWEEAEVGDPLSDVSVTRLDLLWAFGEETMRDFTRRYREQTTLDWRNLAGWDLVTALRPMGQIEHWSAIYADPPISRPDVTADTMRAGHRRFVAQALATLDPSLPA
jgi:aminoglycoside phosphotransferase (APT) family kinase protein